MDLDIIWTSRCRATRVEAKLLCVLIELEWELQKGYYSNALASWKWEGKLDLEHLDVITV